MSILPDNQVKQLLAERSLIIDPFFPKFLGPNTYYCHLGNKFLLPKEGIERFDPLTMESKDIYEEVETNKPIVIRSQMFLLAETFEFLGINDRHVIKLMNSSSLARCGVSHAAVGMVNAGCGMEKPVKLTLELINNAPFDVVLTPTVIDTNGKIAWGTEVLKIAIQTMHSKPDCSYDNWKYAAYNNDQRPSGSKMKGRFDAKSSEYPPKDSLLAITNSKLK